MKSIPKKYSNSLSERRTNIPCKKTNKHNYRLSEKRKRIFPSKIHRRRRPSIKTTSTNYFTDNLHYFTIEIFQRHISVIYLLNILELFLQYIRHRQIG